MRKILALILLSLLTLLCTLASGQTTDSASMIIRSGDATDPWKPCWTHGLWGNPIGDPEAKWTWATYKVSDPQGGETQTYIREFNIDGTPNSGTLKITADDGYTATLNGQELGSGHNWESAQTYNISKQLQPGKNTLTIKATNDPAPGTDAQSNPAGLIYQLVASWPVDSGVQATSGESNDPATWPPYKTKRTDMNYDPNKDSILQNMISQHTKLKEMSAELGRLIGQEADPSKRSVLQGLQQKTLDMIKQLRIDIDNLFYQRLNQFKQTTGAVSG